MIEREEQHLLDGELAKQWMWQLATIGRQSLPFVKSILAPLLPAVELFDAAGCQYSECRARWNHFGTAPVRYCSQPRQSRALRTIPSVRGSAANTDFLE